MNKTLQYDDFIKDSDWIAKSVFQNMYVRINGEDYPIKEWYPDCEQVDNPEEPDNWLSDDYYVIEAEDRDDAYNQAVQMGLI